MSPLEIVTCFAVLGALIFAILGMFGSLAGWGSPIVIIDQGEAGCGNNHFTGNWNDRVYAPGWTFISPLTEVHKYPISKQTLAEQGSYPAANGAKIEIKTTITYHLDENKLSYVHVNYKNGYIEPFVRPAWMTATTDAIASQPLSYYIASGRDLDEMEEIVEGKLDDRFAQEGFVLDSVYLQVVSYPEGVNNAVNIQQETQAFGNDTQAVVDYKLATSTGGKVVVTGM